MTDLWDSLPSSQQSRFLVEPEHLGSSRPPLHLRHDGRLHVEPNPESALRPERSERRDWLLPRIFAGKSDF